jgi:ribonuclease HII
VKTTHIIGVDEAGRGPLAGPVSVGVFGVEKKNLAQIRKMFRGVKESKQLSATMRDKWFKKIQFACLDGLCDYRVILKSAGDIDRLGIAVCIRKAVGEGLEKVFAKFDLNVITSPERTVINRDSFQILLDGGLRAPESFKNQKTIIKGDEKEKLIALASICAKVTRDRLMIKLSKKYPQYEFYVNKGYGTAKHIASIKKHGMLREHRRSFCQRINLPKKDK